MVTEVLQKLHGSRLCAWTMLLQQCGLTPDTDFDQIILLWEGEDLIASGSRKDNLLKCIAVSQRHQGDGHTATLLTMLRQEAFRQGIDHLFLYTKPENQFLFSSLFFYPIARTEQALLMESKNRGIQNFLNSIRTYKSNGPVGSIVMNCDPFTLGHLHLIQTAARECGHVYVFVLSENKGFFSARNRFEMARKATEHIPNVSIHPTGPYLISSATFPTYFLKDRDQAETVHCKLDIEIFLRWFVPYFHISRRYVGSEPLSPMTARYNRVLQDFLPSRGVELIEIPRKLHSGNPISASAVRNWLTQGETEKIREYVPKTTFDYLMQQEDPYV